MNYRNERFNQSLQSLDEQIATYDDISKARVFSDRGQGVARMVAAMDYDPAAESAAERDQSVDRDLILLAAELRLTDAGLAHLIRVLRLIVKNSYNREESLKKVPRRTYFLHRKQLIKFFCCTLLHYRHRGA